jgi:hypothetical protein
MLQRLNVREGQTEEQARTRFDADLGTSAWALPGRERREMEQKPDDGAPYWWHGDEDASQSFLASMGVTLNG